MIRSLFILTVFGDILIEKHYGGHVNRSVIDLFTEEVNKLQGNLKELQPIMSTTRFFLANIRVGELFFVCPIQGEFPPLLVLEFLHRLASLFSEYFKEVTEDSIKNNFVTVYELLDEMMDNGMPFMTEPNILKEMIHPPSLIDLIPSKEDGLNLPEGALTYTPWRKLGLKYSTNEIFFDIIEEIDATVDSNGMMVSGLIAGRIEAVCQLSGMPDLTLIFSNPRIIDDCSFHHCVRYMRWEQERVISFVPPDGPFTLMKYRIFQQVQPPIYCKPQIYFDQYGGKVTVMVGIKSPQCKQVDDVVITIPFPQEVFSVNLSSPSGTVHFDEKSKVCLWNIGKLSKEKSPMLQGTVSLAPGSPFPETHPTCLVNFKCQMYAASGLKVDSLALKNENYKPYKGVRSFTEAGNFQVRC